MLQRLLRVLRPDGKGFFMLFNQMADNVEAMGDKLALIFATEEPDLRSSLVQEIDSLEQQTDSLAHKVFIELSRNFITPFDRDDIYRLVSSLDDVADNIHGSGRRLIMYDMDVRDEYFKVLSGLIKEAVKNMQVLIQHLHQRRFSKEIEEMIIGINVLENKGDDVFGESMQALFRHELDAKNIIKKKELYQLLESTIDCCEDVANIIESILLKEN